LIILDNSVLSAFKRLNELRLIKELFKDVATPTGVYEEFVRGWSPEDFPKWITVETLSDRAVEEAEKIDLGRGEAQAIVYAKHRGCLIALDDEKAREEADKSRISLIGSVGILRIAYESCPIETKERLKELLDKLAEDLYLKNWILEWALEAQKTSKL